MDTTRAGKGSTQGGRGGHRPPLLPEQLLAKLWRTRTGRQLRTVDGRRLRVLYPGRPAPGHGPDFRDALLELDGASLRGDVEVHRRPSEWRAHGHHQNPEYQGVVLHVVGGGQGGGKGEVARLSTVELDGRSGGVQGPARPRRAQMPPLTALASASVEELREALRRAGLARYAEHVQQAGERIRRLGVEGALYEGVLDALGYAENRGPFRALGQLLPVALLKAVYNAHPPRSRAGALGRLVMTGAGWAPVDPCWRATIGLAPLDRSVWKTAGMRPQNHPRRRLEGLVVLLARHLDAGLASAFAQRVAEGPRALLESLRVPDQDGSALVGMGRAMEMAVNAVLPVLEAWSKARKDEVTQGQCLSTYLAFPSLQENTITKEARWIAGNPYLPHLHLNACMQQGLLHLYRQAVGR